MVTFTKRLSTKADKEIGKNEILVHFRHGMVAQYAKTHIYILSRYFNGKEIEIKARNLTPEVRDANIAKTQLGDLCDHIVKVSEKADRETITK